MLNHAVKLPVKFCRVIPADMDVGQLMQKHELRVFLVSKHSPNFLLLPFTPLYYPTHFYSRLYRIKRPWYQFTRGVSIENFPLFFPFNRFHVITQKHFKYSEKCQKVLFSCALVDAIISCFIRFISRPISPYYAIRASFRHPVPQERRRRENPLWSPGPLLRRLHPQHLHPRHSPNEAGCGGHHRRGHQSSDVTKIFPKKAAPDEKIPSGAAPSYPIPVYPRMGQRVGHTRSQKTNTPKKY